MPPRLKHNFKVQNYRKNYDLFIL